MRAILAVFLLIGCSDAGDPKADAIGDTTSVSDTDTTTPDSTDAADTDTTADPDTADTADTDTTADPDTADTSVADADTSVPDTDTTVADTTVADTSDTGEVPDVIDPTVALVVELRWRAPSTPDGLGADLDLHVSHPNTNDGFYDRIWTVFWDNAAPDWGALLTDSQTGAGPEIIEVRQPEDGNRYCVGVRHWGGMASLKPQAVARIRLYANGVRFYEGPERTLDSKDLWEPLCITWQGSAAESTIEEVSRVTPNYSHPFYE